MIDACVVNGKAPAPLTAVPTVEISGLFSITPPVPFAPNSKSMLVSVPVASTFGLLFVALFVKLMWLTALAVFVNTNTSLPEESFITPAPERPAIVGEVTVGVVNVLFVSVAVCALKTNVSLSVSIGKFTFLLAAMFAATKLKS